MKLEFKFSLFLLIIIPFLVSVAQIPAEYKGKPFKDSVYTLGAQQIPGRLQLAYYDLGGEGVAYHDTDPTNNGSGVLNREKMHERPGIPMYICHFRENEGVDISFTKDFADFNHPNIVDPPVNQLYIGWEADGEWTNYTVNIRKAGKYKIIGAYGYRDNKSSIWLNGNKACDLVLPVDTGNWHYWNQAELGRITFPNEGFNLITLKYNSGSNLSFLDFILIEEL